MSRTPARFKQCDVTRALRAARAAGLEVSGYEVDPLTGKIIVKTTGGEKPSGENENEWDKLL